MDEWYLFNKFVLVFRWCSEKWKVDYVMHIYTRNRLLPSVFLHNFLLGTPAEDCTTKHWAKPLPNLKKHWFSYLKHSAKPLPNSSSTKHSARQFSCCNFWASISVCFFLYGMCISYWSLGSLIWSTYFFGSSSDFLVTIDLMYPNWSQ